MASFNSMAILRAKKMKNHRAPNLSSHSKEKLKVSDTDKSSVSSDKENANGNITMEKSTNGYDILSKDKKKKRKKKNCRNWIAARTAQSTTVSSPPQHCPNDETCLKSHSGDDPDLAEKTDVPGPYWHGTPSVVRLLNLYHFVHEQYDYHFSPSSEDLFFFEWMGATKRLHPWLKWKTTNIVARSIGSPDLVSCPIDVRKIPPMFDYYFREDHLGFLRTDQSFYQMNLRKGRPHDQFVKFCFALYQAKAASLPAPEWEVECCDKEVQGDLLTALLSKMPASTPKKVIGKLEELRSILVQPETRPNRRLSTMMTLPPLNSHQQHLNHQAPGSANHRTIARAKALRRSIHQLNDDVSVTPTSSRPSLIAPTSHSQQQHAPASAKKPSGIVTPASKLLTDLGRHNRSNSTLALTKSNKSAAVK